MHIFLNNKISLVSNVFTLSATNQTSLLNFSIKSFKDNFKLSKQRKYLYSEYGIKFTKEI